jgi:uncharacterized protein YlxW (UPF0749 family)
MIFAVKKCEAAKSQADAENAKLCADILSLRSQTKDFQKENKVLQATIKTLNSKLDNQLQMKLEANLAKERLKIRKEKILLQKETEVHRVETT